MNQELKKEILQLCRGNEVHEIQYSRHYEIRARDLVITMRIQAAIADNTTAYELTVANKTTAPATDIIYKKTAYEENAFFKRLAGKLDPTLSALKEIADAMQNKADEQNRQHAIQEEYNAAMRALNAIRNKNENIK